MRVTGWLAAAPLLIALSGCASDEQSVPSQVSPPVTAASPSGPLIFDLLSLMGKTPREVRKALHLCYVSDQYRMDEGGPYPGEMLMVFMHGKGHSPEMSVAFDGRDRCHFVNYGQIESYGYRFNQYAPLLHRLGIDVDQAPDNDAPAGHNWTNWHGYAVHVDGEGPDPDNQKIWQVQIEKARPPASAG